MNARSDAYRQLAGGTVIPAVPLALNSLRKLDEDRQRLLLRYYFAAGVGGLAVGVHTTQFAIRDPRVGLFEPVLQIAAEEASRAELAYNRPLVLIAGACGPTAQAVSEAETAKCLGYDAVLLSPGGLGDTSEEAHLERAREVAKVIPVVGFYLQPAAGGRLFTYDYWAKLCEIKGVIAIKCASFNRYQTLDVMRAVCSSSRCGEIAMYTGNDDNIVIDLLTKYRFEIDGRVVEKSFVGGLLGHWAVWTNKAVELHNELRSVAAAGDIPPKLLTLAEEVTDTNAAFFDAANGFAGCIAGIHEVLRRQGLFEGTWCLDENETLSRGQALEIERVYRMYPHLSDDEFIKANIEAWRGSKG